MNKIIIFTDLDGTLLNEESFSFKQIITFIKNLLKLDTFFWNPFLATFMDFYLIYFVVVPQYVVFLVLEPLGADFELPSGP